MELSIEVKFLLSNITIKHRLKLQQWTGQLNRFDIFDQKTESLIRAQTMILLVLVVSSLHWFPNKKVLNNV